MARSAERSVVGNSSSRDPQHLLSAMSSVGDGVLECKGVPRGAERVADMTRFGELESTGDMTRFGVLEPTGDPSGVELVVDVDPSRRSCSGSSGSSVLEIG